MLKVYATCWVVSSSTTFGIKLFQAECPKHADHQYSLHYHFISFPWCIITFQDATVEFHSKSSDRTASRIPSVVFLAAFVFVSVAECVIIFSYVFLKRKSSSSAHIFVIRECSRSVWVAWFAKEFVDVVGHIWTDLDTFGPPLSQCWAKIPFRFDSPRSMLQAPSTATAMEVNDFSSKLKERVNSTERIGKPKGARN